MKNSSDKIYHRIKILLINIGIVSVIAATLGLVFRTFGISRMFLLASIIYLMLGIFSPMAKHGSKSGTRFQHRKSLTFQDNYEEPEDPKTVYQRRIDPGDLRLAALMISAGIIFMLLGFVLNAAGF